MAVMPGYVAVTVSLHGFYICLVCSTRCRSDLSSWTKLNVFLFIKTSGNKCRALVLDSKGLLQPLWKAAEKRSLIKSKEIKIQTDLFWSALISWLTVRSQKEEEVYLKVYIYEYCNSEWLCKLIENVTIAKCCFF